MITIKKLEEAIDTYKDLDLLLAQCRSTIHELATLGKRHYERAERAERKLTEAQQTIGRMALESHDPTSTVQFREVLQRAESAEAELITLRSGNTKTAQYDLSPAMVEGSLREKLMDMGWKLEPVTKDNSGKRLLDLLAVPPDER